MNIKQYILIASVGFLLFSCGEEVGNNDLDIGSPEEPTIDIWSLAYNVVVIKIIIKLNNK